MANQLERLKKLKGRRVFITGHTGFKGSWLVQMLEQLGAEVFGYSLEAPSTPSHWGLLNSKVKSYHGDIRDLPALEKAMAESKPDLVIHMAAQALVRASYSTPIETYDVNVMGTLKVFEAARKTSSVRAIVNVTSDKCYENREWVWGYREVDPMGGYDPYSSSKGCVELLASSYRRSYFPVSEFKKSHNVLLASVRAGNVIGGGDWAGDRLIPDIVRAASENKTVTIRSPSAIRPWQHVLEPLTGYLLVGCELLDGNKDAADGWNFGPESESCVPVGEVLKSMKNSWSAVSFDVVPSDLHEAHFLRLDSTKAKHHLSWRPRLQFQEALGWTADWYKSFYTDQKLITQLQVSQYLDLLSN